MLRVKLNYLDAETKRRQDIANRYRSEITNKIIQLPQWKDDANHVFHLFVIQIENRNEFQQYLSNHGIQTVIHYPIPPHKQKAYKQWEGVSLPLTEKMHEQVLSLPIDPTMNDEDVLTIIEKINGYKYK